MTPWASSGSLAPEGVDNGVSSLAKQRLTDGEAGTGHPGGPGGRGFSWTGAFGISRTWKAELTQSGKDKFPLSPAPSHSPPGQGEGLCLKSSLCLAGKRWSAACAYLHPALSRPNLTAEARTFVSRVLFEGRRAVGVEYIKNGQSHRVSQAPPGLGSSWWAGMGSRHALVSIGAVVGSGQRVAMA